MAERHLPTPLTPAFQERASAELCTLNNKLNDKLKRDITREVYNRNVLKHKEDAVVAQIRILRGEKEYEVGSPESDVFVTPKASPSDPHFEGSFQTEGNAAYYSLVRHDNKIQHQTLEKELAEQDELSKSFRSIIKKENQQKPDSHKFTKSKIPSKKDASHKALQSLQFNYKLRSHSPQKPKLVLKLKTEPDEMSIKTLGQKEEEIMSNSDSCLEPVSSGYVTGCSPRDTNGSEALGADTTEIATSEDIPHDDKSRGSSSVSSDPGTWDSTFPTNDEDTCVEKENSENIAKSDSIVFFKETDKSIANNNPPDGRNAMTQLEFQAESQRDYLCGFTENDSYVNIKMENKYSSPINNCDYSSSSSVANNFFIDAASLRDENEMYLPSIRNPVFPSTNAEPKTLICDDNSQNSEIDKSELAVRKVDSFLEKEPKKYINSKENEVEDEKKDEFLENRKLIRRNTFDLDPDDTTLNRLKEEYEKSQIKNTSPTINDLNKRNVESIQFVKADFESNAQLTTISTAANEELHSPDSLNNDFHEESFNTLNNSDKKTELGREKDLDYNHLDKNGELGNEQVSSTVENKYLNEGLVTSTLQDNSNADYEKIPATSDFGTSSEFSNLYESHLPIRKGDNENISPRIIDSFSRDNYFNKLECTPIVSGGTQISDVSSSDYSVSASPMTRRKTEFAPILSGGFDNIPSPDEKKSKAKVASSLSTSWIVDMSDTKSLPESLNDNKRERTRSSNSGMGFFVPLDDPYPSLDSVTSNSSFERSDSRLDKKNGHYNERNSACGFYIDLKESNIKNGSKSDAPQEKKLFSMFIDIGNSKSSDSTSPKSKPGSPFFPNKRRGPSMTDRLSTKHLDKKSASTSSDSGLDLGEHPEIVKGRLLFNESLEQQQNLSDCSNNDSGILTKKQGFYMFIGNEESPVTRRRNLPAGVKQNPNRHSWNSDYKQPLKSETVFMRKEHKRSSSVSYDQTFVGNKFPSGPTSIEDSLLMKSKERKNKSMLSSWHGPIKPTSELSRIIANGAKHEFREQGKDIPKSSENSEGDIVEKGEDMSCSIKSDEVFDISNATISSKDDPNRTFVVDDVSKAVNVNTNDLELSTPSHDIASDLSKDESVTDPVQEPKSTSSNVTNRSSVYDADVNTPKLSEFSNSQPALDNSPGGFVKLSDMDKEPPAQTWKSSSKGTKMSRSIPDASFLENKTLTNSASSRSLSRLFPHLYQKTDSREASLQSSMQSSIIEPSPLEVSTEEEGSCGSAGPCSRLGEDLLRMFLDEISPDVTVEVGGRRIKAHKCILSSRCQYFAGMLSGGWVESAGNVISLQGFSYNTVHFALCHIYSGASQIPETINIVELATLADMLCLEGLKEVIMYTLKVKYCHFFHKPCSGCLVGVVECLPLAAAYSLDEIYRKSLRWITKYFVRVWPTKGFASLPKELHEKCFKQHVVHMSCDTVLETVMGCDKLDTTIPNVRWASPVFTLNSKLHEATVKYLTQHFSTVLASTAFMNLGREDSWTVTQLEETLLHVSKSLSPDQACQSYKRIKIILANINKIEPDDIDWKLEFLELLTKLETYIEDCLIRQAGRAARTNSWAKLDPTLRRKIQDAACLVFTPGPRPASASREIVKVNKTNEPKPKSPAPVPAAIRKNVPTTSQSVKTAQSPLPKPKTPKTLAQVKSRYLEPKPARRDTPESQQRRMSGGGKAISSSDSSRTSSPATARVSRPGTAERRTPITGRRLTGGTTETSSPNLKDQRASTSKEPEVKGAILKRQSTFRVATKSSSAKQVLPVARQPSRTRPPSSLPTKTNVGNNNTSGNRPKQSSTTRLAGTFDSFHSAKKSQQNN